MPADSAMDNLNALATWQDALACPACGSTFCAREQRLVCEGCGRAYPIVNGIPVLIADRAAERSDK